MPYRNFFGKNNMRAISAIVIVAIVVVAAVVVGVGVYFATRGSGSSPSASATPTPGSSAVATSSPTSASTGKIATASSYEFNETGTAPNGTVLDTLYYATKNLNTSNVELIEVVTAPSSGTTEYILNGIQQKAWVYANGQWTDISSAYTSQLTSVESTAGIYVNMLEGWGGSGSFSYTIPAGQPNAGNKATFTNIQINPNLPDSLFQPPT